MSEEAIEAFMNSGELSKHRVESQGLRDKLDELIREPAVGCDINFNEVDLSELGVNMDPTPSRINEAITGITPVGLGVSGYGSVTVQSRELTELISLYCDHHIGVLRGEDVISDMDSAFTRLDNEFRDGLDTQILVSAASMTADMGVMVHGVHGPEDVDIVIVEDE